MISVLSLIVVPEIHALTIHAALMGAFVSCPIEELFTVCVPRAGQARLAQIMVSQLDKT